MHGYYEKTFTKLRKVVDPPTYLSRFSRIMEELENCILSLPNEQLPCRHKAEDLRQFELIGFNQEERFEANKEVAPKQLYTVMSYLLVLVAWLLGWEKAGLRCTVLTNSDDATLWVLNRPQWKVIEGDVRSWLYPLRRWNWCFRRVVFHAKHSASRGKAIRFWRCAWCFFMNLLRAVKESSL